jgi:NAD(P)-dependent dehydrogenase (short-subunit alcohol dehydrogenase family)
VRDENESVGEFTGRTVVVTGANSGIGLAAATEFARRGARVALVGRDPARLASAQSEVRAAAGGSGGAEAYQADYAVLDEVRSLAAALASAYPAIDVLCNNAGGVQHRRQTTVDGYELTIQTNHLAPFLLTALLRERLAGGRVVNTSSAAHSSGVLDPDVPDSSGRYRAMAGYGASKQATILFAAEAARRWPEILSFAYHPGVVRTRFGRGSIAYGLFYREAPMLRAPAQGADTMLWLAGVAPSEVDNGGYYRDRKCTAPSPAAADPAIAARLWLASLKAVGLD